MDRRSVLQFGSAIGVAVVAGCTSSLGDEASGGAERPKAMLRMRAVSDSDITGRVYGRLSTYPDERAALFKEAVANGSVTTEDIRPPLRDQDRAVYNGTLYEVSMTIEQQQPATLYPIKINPLAYESVTPAPDADRVRFADLPEVDKERFRRYHLADGEELGIGTNFVYTQAEAEQSALVPQPGYTIIVWESGRKGQFSLRQDAHDVTMSTYRYTGATVAASAAAYGRNLRKQYALDLSDVPPAEADILSAAAEGEDPYRVPPEATPSDPFQSLADRFSQASDILAEARGEDEEDQSAEPSGTYLVRFNGQVYWTRLFIDLESGG